MVGELMVLVIIFFCRMLCLWLRLSLTSSFFFSQTDFGEGEEEDSIIKLDSIKISKYDEAGLNTFVLQRARISVRRMEDKPNML